MTDEPLDELSEDEIEEASRLGQMILDLCAGKSARAADLAIQRVVTIHFAGLTTLGLSHEEAIETARMFGEALPGFVEDEIPGLDVIRMNDEHIPLPQHWPHGQEDG